MWGNYGESTAPGIFCTFGHKTSSNSLPCSKKLICDMCHQQLTPICGECEKQFGTRIQEHGIGHGKMQETCPAFTGTELSKLIPERAESKFMDRKRIAINDGWKTYCLWTQFSNDEFDTAVHIMDNNPSLGIYHAQQAVEKQFKGIFAYCATFDDQPFNPRSYSHIIFTRYVYNTDLAPLFDSSQPYRAALKKITLGIDDTRTKDTIVQYIDQHPQMISEAVGIDINEYFEESELPHTTEEYYEYIRNQIRPSNNKPNFNYTMNDVMSYAYTTRFLYIDNERDFARQWHMSCLKLMEESVNGSWIWRYLALYLHEDARFPSQFTPNYFQNVDAVKRWISDAGYMTYQLQDTAYTHFASHICQNGDYGIRNLGKLRVPVDRSTDNFY